MSQKDQQKMSAIRSSQALNSQALNKVYSAQKLSESLAIIPVENIEQSQEIQVSSEITEIKASQEIKAIGLSSAVSEVTSVNTLFDQLIITQAQALNLISSQVRTGILTEAEAEDQLLLLVLTESMNMPPMIAQSMLASFKESIKEQEDLRQGLRSLWLKD